MIFPLKRNFRDKIFEVSQDFSRGACEGPKFSRLKFSRPDKNPRNPRKFSPSKILGYTVITIFCISNIILIHLISICHLYYSETQVDKNLQPLLWLQLVLVLLPFAFFVIFMGWRSMRKFKAFWLQEPLYARLSTDDQDELYDFPRRALEDSDDENTSNIGSASPRLESAYGSASPKGSSQAADNSSGGGGGSSLLTANTTDNQ